MDTETLVKEVLNSNLSDDAKIQIMKTLFKTEEKPRGPYYFLKKIYERVPSQFIHGPNVTPCEDNWWESTCSK